MRCPKCGEDKKVKNGVINGKQRYKCKNCGCNYTTEEPSKVKFSVKIQALKLYLEGMGFRAIGRYLGVSNVSVLNWIKKFGEIALAIQEKKLEALTEISDLELDELWHFTEKKLKNFGFGPVAKNEQQSLLLGLVELGELLDDSNSGIKLSI